MVMGHRLMLIISQARVERRQQYERAVAEANNEHDLKALEIKFKLEEEVGGDVLLVPFPLSPSVLLLLLLLLMMMLMNDPCPG